MESKLFLETKARSKTRILIWYLFIFFFVWTVKELWFIKYIYLFDNTTQAFLEGSVKSFIWVVPTWLYIKYFLNANPFHYLKIRDNFKKGVFWGIVLSLVFGLYFVAQTYIINKQPFHVSLSLDDYLNTFILAGIIEEMVFRGLILQEINKRLIFWKANLLTALLFVCIHYPIWIHHAEIFNFGTHLYIFLIGLLFGFVYKKTGSLWSVAILHSFHNFFVLVSN
jgi:uncharacterized protein